MSIGLAILLSTMLVGMSWSVVLLAGEGLKSLQQRRRISAIARRVDRVLAAERAAVATGRHRLHRAPHAG
jgi:hypothetical protein